MLSNLSESNKYLMCMTSQAYPKLTNYLEGQELVGLQTLHMHEGFTGQEGNLGSHWCLHCVGKYLSI